MAANARRKGADPFGPLFGDAAPPRQQNVSPLIAWGMLALLMLAVLFGPQIKAWATRPAEAADLSNYETIVTRMARTGLLRVAASNDAVAWNQGLFADDAETAPVLASIGLDHCRHGDSGLRKLVTVAFAPLGQAKGEVSGPECLAMVNAFRSATFLKQDMASTSSAIWDIRGNDVRAMAKGARVVRAVSRVEEEEEAARLFHGSAGKAPLAQPPKLALVADGGSGRAWYLVPGDATGTIDLNVSDDRQAVRTSRSAYCFHGGDEGSSNNCNSGVLLSLLGGSIVVSKGPLIDALTVAIDGKRLTAKAQVMHPGSKLVLARRNGETEISLQLRPLSTRLQSPEGLGGLESAFAKALPDKSVRSTIDLKLHVAAQTLLSRYAAELLTGESTSFRAGVTMMDGMTGAIRAVPTFPYRKDQLVSADRTDAGRLAWLDQNSNFVSLPVGSSAKVPMAASITHVWPDLANRIVPVPPTVTNKNGDQSVETVDGWKITNLGKTAQVETGTGSFDFATFIQRSNNYYALDLMKQAYCRQEFDAVSITQSNTPLARACRNSIDRDPNRNNQSGTNQWAPLETSTAENFWPSAVWKLTCAVPSTVADDDFGGWQQADPSCGDTLWPGVSFASWSGQQRVQPAPIRLNFDQVDDIDSSYGTYLLSILGGGQSLWSTIDLARAYSRVVTMRAVQPRLTGVVTDAAEPFIWWQTKAKDKAERQAAQLAAWRKLLDGMQRVPVSGTASGLIEAVGNDRLVVFAKTGTPDVERPTGDTQSMYSGLDNYLKQGCLLRYSANGLVAVPLARCVKARNGIADELRRANANDDYRLALDERYSPGDLISSIPEVPTLQSNKGHVLVLVFAQLKGDARLPRGTEFPASTLNPGQFCAIRTVAINFQERDDANKTPAIGFARLLLADREFQRWINDRSQCKDKPGKGTPKPAAPTSTKGRS